MVGLEGVGWFIGRTRVGIGREKEWSVWCRSGVEHHLVVMLLLLFRTDDVGRRQGVFTVAAFRLGLPLAILQSPSSLVEFMRGFGKLKQIKFVRAGCVLFHEVEANVLQESPSHIHRNFGLLNKVDAPGTCSRAPASAGHPEAVRIQPTAASLRVPICPKRASTSRASARASCTAFWRRRFRPSVRLAMAPLSLR